MRTAIVLLAAAAWATAALASHGSQADKFCVYYVKHWTVLDRANVCARPWTANPMARH